MNFRDIMKIQDETEQIEKTYELFNESIRLNHSKAARVEFLTTVRYIERYLTPGCKILDIGVGAGEYSIYFARKGYDVSALELTDCNIRAFREKIRDIDNINLIQGNAVDLSVFPDEAFDIVLLLGPLYHLHKPEDRTKCIEEAKRVCRKNGKIFFAFISNDMVFLTELNYNDNYFTDGDYDHETFRLNDFPFVFFTVDKAREMLASNGIRIIHSIASDGVSELMADKINAMSDESYNQYLRYHYYICEKPELLGMSNHLLFAGEKE